MSKIFLIWKAFFIVLMIGILMPMKAQSADVKTSQLPTMKPIDLSISLESDSYYNTTTEDMTSEMGVILGMESFTLGITPTITDKSNEWDMSNIEFSLAYDWKITDEISVSPYGKLNYDSDLDAGDRVIGLKTTIKLY